MMKRVLAGVVTATAAGILFTGTPAGARPAPAGLARAAVAATRVVQGAPGRATVVMSDHHRRRHFRHYRHYRYPYWRHHRHHRHHRHYRHYRHYRHSRY